MSNLLSDTMDHIPWNIKDGILALLLLLVLNIILGEIGRASCRERV